MITIEHKTLGHLIKDDLQDIELDCQAMQRIRNQISRVKLGNRRPWTISLVLLKIKAIIVLAGCLLFAKLNKRRR